MNVFEDEFFARQDRVGRTGIAAVAFGAVGLVGIVLAMYYDSIDISMTVITLLAVGLIGAINWLVFVDLPGADGRAYLRGSVAGLLTGYLTPCMFVVSRAIISYPTELDVGVVTAAIRLSPIESLIFGILVSPFAPLFYPVETVTTVILGVVVGRELAVRWSRFVNGTGELNENDGSSPDHDGATQHDDTDDDKRRQIDDI